MDELKTRISEAKDKCQNAILDAVNTFQEETGLLVSLIEIERKEINIANIELRHRTDITIKVEL